MDKVLQYGHSMASLMRPMTQYHGEFDKKTSMPLLCRREAIIGKGAQMLNLINNAVLVSSAFMSINEKEYSE